MREIPLSSRKYPGLVALVDDEDYERVVAAGPWFPLFTHGIFYAVANARRPDGRHTSLLMHKLITGWDQTDHRDGKSLNNTRGNLRKANDFENARNAGKQRNNTSGFKGVTKRNGKWRAQIGGRVNGKRFVVHLGVFDSPEEAALAYDRAAVERHGEFAYLNFPLESQERMAA